MDSITFHAFWTVFMMAAFVTLIIWVMSGKQKKAFDEASRIPLEDDSDLDITTPSNKGDNHE